MRRYKEYPEILVCVWDACARVRARANATRTRSHATSVHDGGLSVDAWGTGCGSTYLAWITYQYYCLGRGIYPNASETHGAGYYAIFASLIQDTRVSARVYGSAFSLSVSPDVSSFRVSHYLEDFVEFSMRFVKSSKCPKTVSVIPARNILRMKIHYVKITSETNYSEISF